MREQHINHHEEVTRQMATIIGGRDERHRRYSLDKQEEFLSQNHNFHSFSNIIQYQFLNPMHTFTTIQELPLENQHSHSSIFQHESHNFSSFKSLSQPNTPNSFGFRNAPFRQANVSIKHLNVEKTYPNVQIYLVNDNFDKQKAGLLFKFQNQQVDLRIFKQQGAELQRNGQIRQIDCHLWSEDLAEWIQVNATIVLISL